MNNFTQMLLLKKRWNFLLIIASLIIIFIPARSESENDNQFTPYIESFRSGWIDWEKGMIYGIGHGYLHLNRNSSQIAMRAAHVIALQSILKVAAGVRLDDHQTLASLGEGRVVIELKGLVRASEYSKEFINNSSKPYYKTILKAPLKGVEGLTSRLITQLKTKAFKWDAFPMQTPDDGSISKDDNQPWLVLDARKLTGSQKVNPALFPKIISSKGKTVYELGTVSEASLTKRGMVTYVTSDQSATQLQSDRKLSKVFLNKIDDLLSAKEALAGSQNKRQKRRRFIVKEIQQTQGLNRTNLLISENDARELAGEDASSRILKDCRVIVIISTPIGGIEGGIPYYLALSLV